MKALAANGAHVIGLARTATVLRCVQVGWSFGNSDRLRPDGSLTRWRTRPIRYFAYRSARPSSRTRDRDLPSYRHGMDRYSFLVNHIGHCALINASRLDRSDTGAYRDCEQRREHQASAREESCRPSRRSRFYDPGIFMGRPNWRSAPRQRKSRDVSSRADVSVNSWILASREVPASTNTRSSTRR